MLKTIAETLRNFGWWVSNGVAEQKWRWVSWLIHGVAALPFIWVTYHVPWAGPGLLFLYRELEQMWFRFLSGQELDWLDHVMDVLTPGFAGWYFLHGLTLQ